MQSLARTKPGALGQSDHSLGQSCARLVVAWADAELAFERAGAMRKIVGSEGVSYVLGKVAGLGTMKHGKPQMFAPKGGRGARQAIAMHQPVKALAQLPSTGSQSSAPAPA